MSVVLVLFCLVNFAGCLQINVQQATVRVLKTKDAVLKWTFTKNSGERITSGLIQLIPSGSPQQFKTLVLISGQDVATVLHPYSTRQWTVSFSSQEITLTAKDCKPEDDGTYALSLYVNGGASHKVKNINLEVLVLPYFPDGSFTPSPQTFTEGKQVTLKCEPDGSPKPIVIEWIKNNVPLVTKNSNDPNLVMSNVSRNDAGTYECRARNKAGPAIQIPKIEVTIHYKPVNTKFNVTSVLVDGQSGELKCLAEAEPKAEYTIGGGGFQERTGSGIYNMGKILRSHDTKVVKCTPQNQIGIGQIVTLKLDVKAKPKILEKLPKEMNVIEGRNFSIKCSASGKPPAKIVWTKDGSPVRNPPQSLVDEKRTDNTYKSVATLKLAPVTRKDNGKYGCEATNPHGTDTEYVELNLLYLPEVTNTRDFEDREERVGSTVDLDCKADGNPKATYYVWRWPNGTLIQNKTEGKLKISNIQANEGGYFSCAGVSYLGEGKKQYIKLFVEVPPRIIVAPVRRVSLNDSDRLLLFCNASGVPKPTIKWSRDGTILRRTGELLSIDSVKYTDDGEYTCTATNGIEPNDTALTDVTIYFRPVIVSNTATYTIKGADSGEEVQFVCTAEARPVAKFEWLHFPSRLPVSESEADVIRIKQTNDNVFLLEVKARIGAKYLCHAYNNRGNSSQLYEIRAKGTPEAPVLNEVRTYIYTEEGKVSTVRAYVKWTPGYDGGQNVWYKISYGKQAKVPDQTKDIRTDCNCYIITEQLEADKDYVFFVRAHNNAGPSNHSNIISLKTKAFYGKAYFERLDEGKIVRVKFVRFTQDNVTKIVVKYRESKTQDFWTDLEVSDSQEELLIKNLDPEKLYKFQVSWSVGEKQQITDGEVGIWDPPVSGGRSDNSLSREEIIAIIAGVGGFILIVILILFLCLIRRRQKPKRDEAVVVMRRQAPGSVTADIITRRSLIGSVEDDPFESAHYGNQDKKKGKARDSYYLPGSEDLNTFSTDNTARHSVNPAENSQAYQPYRFGDQSKYKNQDDRSSSEDESLPYNGGAGQKRLPSDEELSSEPGYARPEHLKGRNTRDNVEPSRERSKPNKNDVYAKVNKKNNNRPATNGRGAPPPYRPRSTADAPRNLPPYHPDDDDDDDDQLDLDDPSAVPYDDPLPPPMPVLQSPHSVPDIWDNRYPDDPRDSVDSTLERQKSPSRTSLPGKPYRNVHGKLVRPSSSSRLSSSAEDIDDSQQRSPEPEVPSGRSSRHLDLDSDERNLVSYLV